MKSVQSVTASNGIRVRPNPEVIAQNMGQTVVLLHLGTDRFYELNRTAARLWELINGGYDLIQIQHQMLREFDVNAEQLKSELESILTSMKNEGLMSTDNGR
jgi:hypothetical protein